jgi:hypothetical protein
MALAVSSVIIVLQCGCVLLLLLRYREDAAELVMTKVISLSLIGELPPGDPHPLRRLDATVAHDTTAADGYRDFAVGGVSPGSRSDRPCPQRPRAMRARAAMNVFAAASVYGSDPTRALPVLQVSKVIRRTLGATPYLQH